MYADPEVIANTPLTESDNALGFSVLFKLNPLSAASPNDEIVKKCMSWTNDGVLPPAAITRVPSHTTPLL